MSEIISGYQFIELCENITKVVISSIHFPILDRTQFIITIRCVLILLFISNCTKSKQYTNAQPGNWIMILLVKYFALAYSTPLTCTCHEQKKHIHLDRVALFQRSLHIQYNVAYKLYYYSILAKGQREKTNTRRRISYN